MLLNHAQKILAVVIIFLLVIAGCTNENSALNNIIQLLRESKIENVEVRAETGKMIIRLSGINNKNIGELLSWMEASTPPEYIASYPSPINKLVFIMADESEETVGISMPSAGYMSLLVSGSFYITIGPPSLTEFKQWVIEQEHIESSLIKHYTGDIIHN